MAFLDELSGIFTGGLGVALDIEAERARAEIDNKRITEDNQIKGRGDSGVVYPKGSFVSPLGDISPLVLAGGAGALVLLVVLLTQRG